MPATHLFSHLDYRQKDQLTMNAKWEREIDGFVRKGVIQLVDQSVIDALRDNGQFEEDFEPFREPDYDKMVENDGTIIIGDGADPFWFKSDNLSTAEMKDDGTCMIDLHAWCKDNGIKLEDWSFDVRHLRPVTGAERNDSGNCPEDDVFAGLVTAEAYSPAMEHDGMWSAQDAIVNVIIPILRQQGNDELADKLEEDAWAVIGADALESDNGRFKYVNYDFESEEQFFDKPIDAMRDACEVNEVEDQYREIFQYFLVNDYFGNLLKDQGMAVAEIANLTVWGRESCGMSISMEGYAMRMFAEDEPQLADRLIREILPEVAAKLDAEHDADLAVEKSDPGLEASSPTQG